MSFKESYINYLVSCLDVPLFKSKYETIAGFPRLNIIARLPSIAEGGFKELLKQKLNKLPLELVDIYLQNLKS